MREVEPIEALKAKVERWRDASAHQGADDATVKAVAEAQAAAKAAVEALDAAIRSVAKAAEAQRRIPSVYERRGLQVIDD